VDSISCIEVITFLKNKPKPCYIFIDEIQEIKEWERSVNSLLADQLCDITITGSNAQLLSSELATLLSGRFLEFEIYPLSFREFLQFRDKASDSTTWQQEFRLFMKYGGLPAIHDLDLVDDQVQPYLNAIFNTVLVKDVLTRNKIRDPNHMDRIIRFVFANCGNITSSKRITDYLKNQKMTISADKVLGYIHYLEKAMLIFKVLRHDIKGRRNLELYEKYYMGDIGLRHGLIRYNQTDIIGILENIVYLDLKKRGFIVHIGKFGEKEVDFVAEKSGKRLYLQVSYLLASPETIEREFSVLESIDDNHPKIVLSLDEQVSIQRKGISQMNLVDFLLRESQSGL
jgi:predicted AAA+ superfamily ATPase